jgi:hypothetical protein
MASLIAEDLTQPGTHALVIGISAYLHFEDGRDPTPRGIASQMEQLSAAAHSASEFAWWLLEDYCCDHAPLRSLRVLFSPADGEIINPNIAPLLRGDFAATRDNVKIDLLQFKEACDTHVENVAIIYVAGHGVQLTSNGAIVLLHDFGSGSHLEELEGAIDMVGVHAGMRHPNTARTQFWFVDTCRQRPSIAKRFETLTGALSLSKPIGDTESSPLFLAATTGKEAFARVGGTTLFNEALMWAMRGGAAVGPEDNESEKWHVSVTTLIRRLPERVKALANLEGAEQSVDLAGKPTEAVLHEFDAAPMVDLTVALTPEEAKSFSKGTLKYNASMPIIEDFDDWPMHMPVEAGLYLLSVETSPPFTNKTEILALKPPDKNAVINVKD